MLSYLLRRLCISLVVLWGLSLVTFFMVRWVPGDTAAAILGTNYNEQDAERIRGEYGLDKPLIVQYGLWLGRIFQGDFGQSISGRPVEKEILDALPVTLELMLLSLCFAILFGIPLGVLSAIRQNKPTDMGLTVIGLLGISVPAFWLGTLLILVFSLHLRWLPAGQFVSLTVDPVANLRHMILPTLALGTAVAAVLMRMTRASMLEVIRQDYVRAARAKGLSETRVTTKHALFNAIIPVMTVAGIQAAYLLGGSVVVEEVFTLNGVGRLALRAIGNRDYPLLQSVILLIGSAFLLINFCVDIAYSWVNPSIRVLDE